MKKWFVICFALCISLALFACTGEDAPSASSNPSSLSAQEPPQSDASASPDNASEPGDLDVYSRTEGTWLLNGDTEAGYLIMDGMGAYELYDSEEVSLSSGQLYYTAENDKFMMQANDMDDTQYDTFYFEDDARIVFEGAGSLYIKQASP